MKRLIVICFLLAINFVCAQEKELKIAQQTIDKGDYPKALELYNEIIAKYPKNFEALANRGMLHLFTQNGEEAVNDFTLCISLRPKYADSYNARGLAYMGLDIKDSAYADFCKAIELDPKFAEPYSNRGEMAMNAGNLDTAKSDFLRAIKLNSKNPAIYFNLGKIEYFQKNYKKSIEYFSKAEKYGLNNPQLFLQKGNAHYRVEDYKNAVAAYTKSLNLEPNNIEVLNNRAISYDKNNQTELGDKDRALLAELRKAILPDTAGLKLVPYKDPTSNVEMLIPEGWNTYFEEDSTRINIIVSKDKIDPAKEPLIRGFNFVVYKEMPEEFKSFYDPEIPVQWVANQSAATKHYLQYQYKSQKNGKFNGWEGVQNDIIIQVNKNSTIFEVYEFVACRHATLYYAYLQAPFEEFSFYSGFFEQIIKSFRVEPQKKQ